LSTVEVFFASPAAPGVLGAPGLETTFSFASGRVARIFAASPRFSCNLAEK
jgi:hypothetical protein